MSTVTNMDNNRDGPMSDAERARRYRSRKWKGTKLADDAKQKPGPKDKGYSRRLHDATLPMLLNEAAGVVGEIAAHPHPFEAELRWSLTGIGRGPSVALDDRITVTYDADAREVVVRIPLADQ